jgi:hypothetical protein
MNPKKVSFFGKEGLPKEFEDNTCFFRDDVKTQTRKQDKRKDIKQIIFATFT